MIVENKGLLKVLYEREKSFTRTYLSKEIDKFADYSMRKISKNTYHLGGSQSNIQGIESSSGGG